jgi:glycyl-tRNA synthetase beta chain
MDDRSPETKSGAVLSISDKLDTVLGCFSVGLIPTGSEDPLGLRRAMQGVIKVLLDHKLPFSMAKAAGDGFTPQLKQFYEDRLRFILSQRGFAYDEINAVTAIGCDDPSETPRSSSWRFREFDRARTSRPCRWRSSASRTY